MGFIDENKLSAVKEAVKKYIIESMHPNHTEIKLKFKKSRAAKKEKQQYHLSLKIQYLYLGIIFNSVSAFSDTSLFFYSQ